MVLGCRSKPPAWPYDTPPPPAQAPDADLVYFLLVDRFANGDPTNDGEVDPSDPQAFHGGDLRGVRDNLDHLEQLGVRTVVISPVFAMRTTKFGEWGAYHGYWVEDLRKVEPRFGTEEELRLLADDLRARDMRLVLDMVYNHTAPDSQLLAQHPDWFHTAGSIDDWQDPVEVEQGQVHGLPDLDQENDEVHRYLRDATLHWAQRVGVDGLRLDAVRHMPNAFLQRIGQELEAATTEDLWLLGEIFDGSPAAVASASTEGALDAVFDYPLYYAMSETICDGKPLSYLAGTLAADRDYPPSLELVTFADNHDVPRVRSRCGDAARTVLFYQLTARGTPSLLYGTESELSGAAEPANRADMVFEQTQTKAMIEEIMALRRANPVFGAGGDRVLRVDDDVLATVRVQGDQAVVVALSRAKEELFIPKPNWLMDAEVVAVAGVPETSASQVERAGLWVRQGSAMAVVFEGVGEVPAPGEREVRLFVKDAEIGEGDRLVAVGPTADLGGWKPEGAPAFEPASGGDAGRGRVLALELPADQVAMYKLAIVRADGSVHWEQRDSRTTTVYPGQAPVEVDLRWGR